MGMGGGMGMRGDVAGSKQMHEDIKNCQQQQQQQQRKSLSNFSLEDRPTSVVHYGASTGPSPTLGGNCPPPYAPSEVPAPSCAKDPSAMSMSGNFWYNWQQYYNNLGGPFGAAALDRGRGSENASLHNMTSLAHSQFAPDMRGYTQLSLQQQLQQHQQHQQHGNIVPSRLTHL